ncbi:hypothetical protein [Paraburkholderia sp. D1E]|uniref:hypothetical protein n=1 Tax=Paraburkholderia sp. D1E TaxID=3461398 RepID=UPI00404524CB
MLTHLLSAKKGKHGMLPQVVTVAHATLGSMPGILSEPGTVTPTATVTVMPQLSGYLTAGGYRECQDVQRDKRKQRPRRPRAGILTLRSAANEFLKSFWNSNNE